MAEHKKFHKKEVLNPVFSAEALETLKNAGFTPAKSKPKPQNKKPKSSKPKEEAPEMVDGVYAKPINL